MSDERANVRLQNLRDFTVQIRRLTGDKIVGTGVIVSTKGEIVTCAHVAKAALGRHPRQANGKEIGVYFPQARGGEEKKRCATVAGCFPVHDDDVVLLQLAGGPPPLGPEQIAVLGTAGPARDHTFQSYGYSSIGAYPALYAVGRIIGPIERPSDRLLQADPIQLQSRQLDRGMSGAAVLDEERNLVVGIVAERVFPTTAVKDDVGYAVDARVLTFDPINFPLREEDLPKRAVPRPKTDIDAARAAVAPDLGMALHGAPPPLPEWVGRDDLLESISADWAAPECHVTGLIGFGGEGKSSLARRWLDSLGNLPSDRFGRHCPTPDGIFWWGFYDRPGVDEFFEATLTYMGGEVMARRVRSANVRAQVIGAMLGAGRYLFVLDGLEVMQHQEGDRYGLLRSSDLREFLGYFAAPAHESFCLITSRAPLLDLMAYTTYTHRDVSRLSPADGRALLRRVGVVGQDAILFNVVADWDGHALTLGLLGGYLAERHGGNITHIGEIPPPTADEPRYERVHRVLRRYDEHLTEAERAFLTLFSAFRTPVHESAFDKVFRPLLSLPTSPPLGQPPSSPPLSGGTEGGLPALVQRLVAYRILRHDPRASTYTTHPLIRNHYLAHLTAGDPSTGSGQAAAQDAYARIKDYYLELAGDTPKAGGTSRPPTLDDLAPLIEVVHHACRAGAYDEAHRIRRERISQRNRHVLIHQLGAYETALAIRSEFFPNGDTSKEPQVSDPRDKSWLLNGVGLCLMSLGRLDQAVPFYERAVAGYSDMEDWHNASIGYQNLAGLHAHLGTLAESADAAREALALARRAENKQDEWASLAYQARAIHLHGDLDAANVVFKQAEAVLQEDEPSTHYLDRNPGIWYAEHLRRLGDAVTARRVTEVNLETCERNRWAFLVSMCHRVLGDLSADEGDHESARAHYDEALRIARSITHRHSLIEALLARGRWAARNPKGLGDPSGLSDLNEALVYAVDGGYRIYEADVRVALAWTHLAEALTPSAALRAGPGPSPRGRGEALAAARQEAERAQQMSVQMDYHWGQVDAAEVLAALDEPAGFKEQ